MGPLQSFGSADVGCSIAGRGSVRVLLLLGQAHQIGGCPMSRAIRPALGIGSRLVRFASALGAPLLLTTFLAVGTAYAGLGVGAAVNFPTAVTVGDTGLPASIQLQTNNSWPDTSGPVWTAGDPFPCPVSDPGIPLSPSCGQLGAFSACVPA